MNSIFVITPGDVFWICFVVLVFVWAFISTVVDEIRNRKKK